MELEIISCQKSFGGTYNRYKHYSPALNCDMIFGVFLPAAATKGSPAPVLYWLSGLTCTDENFMQKAGAHKIAAQLGMILVTPDTSPRGDHVPKDPNNASDFGIGAGFYVDATQQPWAQNYRMHEYVVSELPAIIEENFPASDRRGISGHSMGGHGALICALRNPGRYLSVSAFSPVTNPMECGWGQKALGFFLGSDRRAWESWDACRLMAHTLERLPILIDQGEDDQFIDTQLKPHKLLDAAGKAEYELNLRTHHGYDHSYYFVASFISDHLHHHAKALTAPTKAKPKPHLTRVI